MSAVQGSQGKKGRQKRNKRNTNTICLDTLYVFFPLPPLSCFERRALKRAPGATEGERGMAGSVAKYEEITGQQGHHDARRLSSHGDCAWEGSAKKEKERRRKKASSDVRSEGS